MARPRNVDVADQLLDVAARILAEEGHPAVTARRLTNEVGASTMAVYTHFGSMDELFAALWRRGFERFGAYLAEPGDSGDPLLDWAAQGWAYRQFALDNPNLYRVMFSEGITAPDRADGGADADNRDATFGSLIHRLRTCADAGQLHVDGLEAAAQVVWSTVHGHMSIELTGWFERRGRDPVAAYHECLVRLGMAFGGDPTALRAAGAAVTPSR